MWPARGLGPSSACWCLGSACRWPGPGGWALQACHSCRPSPGSVLRTACACCFCKPSSFARQSKESLLVGNEASSLTDSPSRVPSCQPSWTCSSCLCALSAACPSPAHGALWVPPAGVPCIHTDLPLAQCWSARAPSRPCGSLLSSLERAGADWRDSWPGGKGREPQGTLRASGDSWRLFAPAVLVSKSDRSIKTAFHLFCVPSVTVGAVRCEGLSPKHMRSHGKQAAVQA